MIQDRKCPVCGEVMELLNGGYLQCKNKQCGAYQRVFFRASYTTYADRLSAEVERLKAENGERKKNFAGLQSEYEILDGYHKKACEEHHGFQFEYRRTLTSNADLRKELAKAKEQVKRQREAMEAILPYCRTESEGLDDAGLNEGQASGFGIASMMIRKELAGGKTMTNPEKQFLFCASCRRQYRVKNIGDREVCAECSSPMRPLTQEMMDNIRANHKEIDHLKGVIRGYEHGDSLMRADLQPWKTDCSTPTYIMVKNLVAEVERLRTLLNMETPCGLITVLEIFVKWSNHWMIDHGCDHHGYELVGHAIESAKVILNKIGKG